MLPVMINTLRPRQNGRHFPDDIYKWIFVNENVWISIKISLKFVPWGLINNIPSLVQIMAWRRPGDKPLSEPRTVSLLTHIRVTRPKKSEWHPYYTRLRILSWWDCFMKIWYIITFLIFVTNECTAYYYILLSRFRWKFSKTKWAFGIFY